MMSPLFGVFSRGSLVKMTAATSGKISQRVVKRQTHVTIHQKQERFRCWHSAGYCWKKMGLFFFGRANSFCACVDPFFFFFWQGLLGVSVFFISIFNLTLIFFFYPLQYHPSPASDSLVGFVTIITLAKVSKAAELFLRLPKQCKTFDSPL